MTLQDFAQDESLRATIRRLQQQLAQAKDAKADLIDAVYQAAKDGYVAVGPPPKVERLPRDRRKHAEEVALIHFTDWQRGKVTETYSPAICDARIDLAIDKIATITDVQRADHPVKRAAVMIGGDNLENINIFPGQEREVEGYAYQQLFGLTNLLKHTFRRLLTVFETIDAYEQEGNHGRIGRKAEWPRTENLDLMAMEITRRELASEKRIIWHPRQTWHQMVPIGNYTAMLVHGDQIKSFGGNLPSYGIVRRATAWAAGVVEPYTDLYLGHFHQVMRLPLPNGRAVFMTGSPESGNEYAREFIGGTGQPSQRLHFVDPERGRVTAEYVLWLDEIK